MTYREELLDIAEDSAERNELGKIQIMNRIQVHAINQIKEGYTSFRINRLKKEDEKFLKEWADITEASVKVLKFRCFENGKKYLIKQFTVDLASIMGLSEKTEGKTLNL